MELVVLFLLFLLMPLLAVLVYIIYIVVDKNLTTMVPTTTIVPTTTMVPTTTIPSPQVAKTMIGFFPNWGIYVKNFFPVNIPISVMPEISYAFFDIQPDPVTKLYKIISTDSYADTDKVFSTNSVNPPDSYGDANPVHGCIGQFMKLKTLGNNFSLRMGIGGWTLSKNFSSAVADSANRNSFAQSIVNFIIKYPIFTGIDIDWEYLSNNNINYGNTGNTVSVNDAVNFTLFLTLLKSLLSTANLQNVTIGVTVTPAPEKIAFDPTTIISLVDYIEIMTYDFHDGAWGETISSHNSNPRKSSYGKYSCEESADAWIAKGVPSTKILIGAAYYSRGFSNTLGLGKVASGGSTDISTQVGIVNYGSLPLQGATEYLDPESKSAYSYDPVKKVFNSYDNPESVIEKCRIVFEKNLKGIISWDLSTDAITGSARNLSSVIYKNLITNPIL